MLLCSAPGALCGTVRRLARQDRAPAGDEHPARAASGRLSANGCRRAGLAARRRGNQSTDEAIKPERDEADYYYPQQHNSFLGDRYRFARLEVCQKILIDSDSLVVRLGPLQSAQSRFSRAGVFFQKMSFDEMSECVTVFGLKL